VKHNENCFIAVFVFTKNEIKANVMHFVVYHLLIKIILIINLIKITVMKRKYQLQCLNTKTNKWEAIMWVSNKNYPCCSKFERVI
jgi:hypothetical protein